jgi:hypothetical protein
MGAAAWTTDGISSPVLTFFVKTLKEARCSVILFDEAIKRASSRPCKGDKMEVCLPLTCVPGLNKDDGEIGLVRGLLASET